MPENSRFTSEFLDILEAFPFVAKANQKGELELEWLGDNPFPEKNLFTLLKEKDADDLKLEMVRAHQNQSRGMWNGMIGVDARGNEEWMTFSFKGAGDQVLGVARDVSDKFQLKNKLRTLWEYSRITSRNLNGFTFVGEISPNGQKRFLYTSLTDLHPEDSDISETAGFTENFLTRIHPEDRESLENSLKKAFQPSDTWEWRGRFEFPSYGYRWMQGRGTFLAQKDGTIQVRALVQDVTQLVDREEKTREIEAQFREITKNIPGMLYRCAMDEHWTIDFVSDGVDALTGYPKEDFINNQVRTYNSIIHPEDQPEVFAQVEQGVRDRQPFTLNYRIIHRDGTIKWVSEKGQAIYDEKGEVSYLNGAIFDITEMRKLEDALFHAQKMESLGIMAGGVAHDFNNLLVSIMGFNELAKITLSDSVRAENYIDNAIKASRQAAELCKQMLAYAGRGQFELKLVDLNSRILDISHLLKASLGKGVALHFELSPRLSAIKADPSQVDQILMNFILNASEAIEGNSGNIYLKTEEKHLTKVQLSKNRTGQEFEEGNFVVLSIQDDGKGMSRETYQKIFDPFFSTKPTGRGLGLASVLGILKHHGAGVFLQSELGKGSLFTVVFPSQQKVIESVAKPPEKLKESLKKQKILIVDDDPQVLEITGAVLEQGGYVPVPFLNGQEAIETVLNSDQKINAALVDMNMPKMNGLAVLQKLKEHFPQLPILLTSGYQRVQDLGDWQANPSVKFLPKPFSPVQLLNTLKELIDQQTKNSGA